MLLVKVLFINSEIFYQCLVHLDHAIMQSKRQSLVINRDL